jgi:DNA-binding beta-propeller fold protein YncE
VATGYATQVVLPLVGLVNPVRVALDQTGALCVSLYGNNQVFKFPAGSTSATPLPFPGNVEPSTLAVSADGAVCVGSYAAGRDQLFRLTAGASRPARSLGSPPYRPMGLAVDSAGNVYVASQGERLIAS